MSKARDISKSTETLDVDGGTIKLDGNYPVGTSNVALGDQALNGSMTGQSNVAIGSAAGVGVTSGSHNAAIGTASLLSNTTGNYNTGIGRDALRNNTTASNNTAVGYQSLYNNTSANNTALGNQSGLNATTATGLVLIGREAGKAITTGSQNTALGYDAMQKTTTGGNNVALGFRALFSNTTASNNTAVGYEAGYSNTTGIFNTLIGYQAGYSATTARNTCVGIQAGYQTTGSRNQFFGDNAGSTVTTGTYNTILGGYNGNQGGLDIRTSSNNIVLSDGDGNPRGIFDSSGNFLVGKTSAGSIANFGGEIRNDGTALFSRSGNSALFLGRAVSTGDLVEFYYGATTPTSAVGSISTNGTSTAYNTSSDYRLKENVVELTGATDRIKQIPVHRFNFIADPDTTVDGFLAHEVQAVVPEAVTGTKDEVDADGNPVYQGIDQSKLVPLLVATIKELEARITALEAK